MGAPPEAAASEQDGAFGARLRRAREAAGLAQEELAERAGLSVNTVGGLERGEHQHPHPATVRALAAALGLSDAERATLAAASPPRGRPATAADATPSGLPAPLSSLIGREREVAAVSALLRDDDVRLVTLTGPGGVGKTRLALQIAAQLGGEFTHRAAFVALAPIRDPALVPLTIAHALGVVESTGRAPVDRLADALRDRHQLLVLDNLEHLLDAAPLVTDLLGRCPRLEVLVTSRVTLRLDGEQVFPVPPLAVPDPDLLPQTDELAGVAAVRLFVERAHAADPAFVLTGENAGAVAAVCHRLDGLPLAIELAAARSALLPPAVLLPLLARRLPLLTEGRRDAPERHRTMGNAIGWSHDLLTAEEQWLFQRLSVFVGGCTLETAAVASAESGDAGGDVVAGIAALMDNSLIRREAGTGGEAGDGAPRYVMLETVREYGLDRLAASGDEAAARAAHAAAFLAWAERTEPALYGPTQAAALAEAEAELGNVRAALAWFLGRDDAAAVLHLAVALWDFWLWRGHLGEGRKWLEAGLAHGGAVAPALRAKALQAAGMLAYEYGNAERAADAVGQSLVLCRTLGLRGLAGNALVLLGRQAESRGDLDAAAAYLAEARAELEESRHDAEKGGDRSSLDEANYLLVAVDINSGAVAYGRGELELASAHYEDALNRARAETLTEFVAAILGLRGLVDRDRGDHTRAVAAHREALTLHAAMGDRGGMAQALANLATLAANWQPELAARLLGAADGHREQVGLPPYDLSEHTAYGRARSAALTGLGEAAFAAAWAAGRALSIEQAIAEALAVVADPAPIDAPVPLPDARQIDPAGLLGIQS